MVPVSADDFTPKCFYENLNIVSDNHTFISFKSQYQLTI